MSLWSVTVSNSIAGSSSSSTVAGGGSDGHHWSQWSGLADLAGQPVVQITELQMALH